jgi:hypothetical protein
MLQAPKFLKFQLVRLKEICSRLATTEQVGHKNRNGKTTTVLFPQCFLEGKSGICLLLAIMFIGDDWLVDLTIIYIEKTIATALDINNTIKSFYGGCQLNESKSLNK